MGIKKLSGEALKNLTLNMPVRRSQMANWGIRLLQLNKPFVGNFMGKQMLIDPNDAASRSAYFLGYYERETTMWTLDYVRKHKPEVILDVGAHFGYFIYLCTIDGHNPKIFAFEPDPSNQEWLLDNLKMSGMDQCTQIISKAVSDRTKKVSFAASNPEEGETLWARVDESQDGLTVDATSLDEFCEQNKISKVDLLKMDIEGGEGLAIKGMSEGIKKGLYKNILLEMHPLVLSEEHSPEKLVHTFLEHGYKAYKFRTPDVKHPDKSFQTYDLEWKPEILTTDFDLKNVSDWDHFLLKAP